MKHTVAVLSDIHSNVQAFRACYEDALDNGADSFVFLGDYISDLADARGTMDLLYEIRSRFPVSCLRGNRERYMLERERGEVVFTEGSKSGSLLHTYGQLRTEDLRFFQQLPDWRRVCIGGVTFQIAHAFKGDDRCCFGPGDARIGQVFAQMEEDLLFTGHSHRQYMAREGTKTIVNPGSVGIPQDGRWLAAYALFSPDPGQVRIRLRQVPYDILSTIRDQFSSGAVSKSHCWGISCLYDIIYGREGTLRLLEAVERDGDVRDEQLWRRTAERMGMAFTESEILALARKVCLDSR